MALNAMYIRMPPKLVSLLDLAPEPQIYICSCLLNSSFFVSYGHFKQDFQMLFLFLLQTYPAQLMATPPCLQLLTPQNLGTLLDSSYSHHVPPVGISFCFYLDVISTFSPFLTISTVTTLVQATIISSLYHCRNLTGLLVSASGSQHRQSDSVET